MFYDANSGSCGNYDTLNFVASEKCCTCGGGISTSASIVENAVASTCVDDNSTKDSTGDDCSWYTRYPSTCGNYDSSEFVATNECCACGGGSFKDAPVNEATPED
jgi:hypothetical protein